MAAIRIDHAPTGTIADNRFRHPTVDTELVLYAHVLDDRYDQPDDT